METTVGVLLGLAAATAQSVSYILSRLYVIRRAGAFFHLLVLGHLIMGAMSVAALPWLPLDQLPPVGSVLWPLIGSGVFYLLGQAGMFIVLRHQEASRLSPLLGLKIPILAFITVMFLDKAGKGLTAWQWSAVAISVAAALVLRTSGKRMPWTTIAGIVVTCVFYSLSDLHIRMLTDALGPHLGKTQAVLTGVALTYVLCGLIGLAAMPWAGRPHKGDWSFALPWAASWLAAMVVLYGCFATIGVIYGNILQSTRGLISIVMGAAVAALGHLHLEPRTTRVDFIRRVAAAVMMIVAITMYSPEIMRRIWPH
ncbi:MAG: hypothetical protein ACE15C_18360 [Phycisphaerae bacterium]